MSIYTKDRHQARVELVIDIIKGIFEKETIPEAFKEKLNTMSYDGLGTFVMDIVKKRSVDEFF
ncbi:hypothetical protein [Paenibacillus sp. YIM B09110]|uniref:hypothetical protein n=1 Tax=Paenibacillus sp. YIM B09110 TaxID=3126102 RepID=UPI00301C40DC